MLILALVVVGGLKHQTPRGMKEVGIDITAELFDLHLPYYFDSDMKSQDNLAGMTISDSCIGLQWRHGI